MTMLRFATAIALLTSGCGLMAKEPSFEIRNFALKSEESTYATTFMYAGTLLIHGNESVAKKAYIVAIEYRYLGGGNPERTHDSTTVGFVTVLNGAGDLAVGAGYRPKEASYQKAETWPPEKYSARVIGYVPITPVTATK